MRNITRTVSKSMLVASCSLLIVGCGGDGEGTPADFVLEQTPRCTKTTTVDADLVATQIALTRLHELIGLATIEPEGGALVEESGLSGFDVAGQCGGWVYFTPQPGETALQTDYELDLQAYCNESPEGNVLFTGRIDSSEISRVVDEQALVSELHTGFDNVIAEQGSDLFRISVTGARTVYGNPAPGRPLDADNASPDRITVEQIRVNHESAGVTDSVTGLAAKRWPVEGGEALDISAGQYVHGKTGDRFTLSTPAAPLIADPDTGEWTSGTLVLTSRIHPTVHIKPSGTPGDYQMIVPGNALGDKLGCEVVDQLAPTP